MLTDTQMRQWEEDGFVRLGQVMSDAQLEALRARIDDIMLGRIRYEGMYFQLDSETGAYGDLKFNNGWTEASLNYRKIQDLERDPLFLEFMQHPTFRGLSRQLVAEEISVFRAMFMNKPAHRGTHLPYHQDGGDQWGLDREHFVTVWTALDEATIENGCVQVIPGSHKLGLLSAHGHTITAEQEAEFARDEDSVYLDCRAGESILLHNYVLHRSGINQIERPRRAFSVVYMDAATRSTKSGQTFPKIFGEGALQPA